MIAYQFRKAHLSDLPQIWAILQAAIVRRKADGSDQWQDGYPNPEVIKNDLEKGAAFVLAEGEIIAAYVAIIINDEPAYAEIEGKWLTNGDFVVVHRIAVSPKHLGKGLALEILNQTEAYARDKNILSIRADTNFDNPAMLKIFEKTGYVYCGEVFFRGSARKAYEKVLK